MTGALDPRYRWAAGGAPSPSLLALIGDREVRLDARGVRAAFGEEPPSDATCIAGAVSISPSPRLAGRGSGRGGLATLHSALEAACARLPLDGAALALSGGLDSAVLLALLRAGGPRLPVYTLAADMPGYGEADETLATARALGADVRLVRVVRADAEAFVGALPEAVRVAERPLYNLHPVARYLLARQVRADGLDALVTGDGADEVFRGEETRSDYLPVVGALMRGAGVTAHAPFLDPLVVAACAAPDPDKRALRALAPALGVPPAVALRPKQPRLAPPMDLGRFGVDAEVRALGRRLGRVPSAATDRDRVRWTTLALFARCLPACAA